MTCLEIDVYMTRKTLRKRRSDVSLYTYGFYNLMTSILTYNRKEKKIIII